MDLDWMQQLPVIGYISSIAQRMLSLHLGCTERELQFLLVMYALERPVVLRDFYDRNFHHKQMMLLISKGLVAIAGEFNPYTKREYRSYSYELSYESKVIIDCYYGALKIMLESIGKLKIEDVFGSIHDIIHYGYEEAGYDIDKDIYRHIYLEGREEAAKERALREKRRKMRVMDIARI